MQFADFRQRQVLNEMAARMHEKTGQRVAWFTTRDTGTIDSTSNMPTPADTLLI